MDIKLVNSQNMQVCFLTQAMCGAVTPNWRSVSISFDGKDTHLHFVLELESAEDREEIEDVAFEFSVFQEDQQSYRLGVVEVSVTADALPPHLQSNSRVVYRRKELR